jgi:hypothetical protein
MLTFCLKVWVSYWHFLKLYAGQVVLKLIQSALCSLMRISIWYGYRTS